MDSQKEKKEKISTRRTYLLLSRSLFQLLEETPFEKISLTQLCDDSMVPRSTFYRYFEDKYDLLYYCLETFFEAANLNKDVIYLKDKKARKFVQKLILEMDKDKESFQQIWKTNKNGIFMDILRDYLIQRLETEVPYCRLNGDRHRRLPNNVNFSFRFVEGESLLIMLDMEGICASSGSACTSGSLDPSHVLLAIGLPHEIAHGSLRLTLGEETTKEELDRVVEVVKKTVDKLRAMSPLYEDFVREQKEE